jgi:hypothetical protein
MTDLHDAWLAKHRARWLRPNARLYLRADAQRFLRPDAQRFLRHDWTRYVQPGFDPLFVHALPEGKANFNPDQPRVPRGHPDGGQWTRAGGGGGVPPLNAHESDDGSDGNDRTEFGAARRQPKFTRPRGHHPVPRAVFQKRPFPPDTKKVFEETTTGRLRVPHTWSRAHDIYNQAVGELLDSFLAEKSLTPETTRPPHAREFIDVVRRSTDPRIRNFTLNLMRREIMHIMRVGPRGLH